MLLIQIPFNHQCTQYSIYFFKRCTLKTDTLSWCFPDYRSHTLTIRRWQPVHYTDSFTHITVIPWRNDCQRCTAKTSHDIIVKHNIATCDVKVAALCHLKRQWKTIPWYREQFLSWRSQLLKVGKIITWVIFLVSTLQHLCYVIVYRWRLLSPFIVLCCLMMMCHGTAWGN